MVLKKIEPFGKWSWVHFTHGLWTANEAFFSLKSRTLGRQIGQINSGAFGGIFGQTISTHFCIVSPLSMISIIQFFLQKTLIFRPNPNISQIWYWPKRIWKIAIIHPFSVAKCMQSTSWKGSFTAGNSAVEDQLTQASRTRPTRATGRGRRNQGDRRGAFPYPRFRRMC